MSGLCAGEARGEAVRDRVGPYLLGPNDENQGVYCGKAGHLALEIPDESIDVIFTDPPYSKEYLSLYGWLAFVAARILKPGGFLCTLAGGYYLDRIFALMSGNGLDWYFKIEFFVEGDSPVIFPRRIVTRTKPVLMWTKGPGVIKIWNMTDVYQGQGKDKQYHRWGQDVGIARYCLEYIVGTGADNVIVLDPFVGAGSTLEACQILGLKFLAFDIDPDAVTESRHRVSTFMPPLFVPQAEQARLEGI